LSRRAVISKKFIDSNALAASLTSQDLFVDMTDYGSIVIKWANGSAANFSISIEARNGSDKQDTYRVLDFGSPASISGASGEHEFIFNSLPFTFMRVVLTRVAGSADIDATFTYKSMGS
jgi:hypothetical protein